MTELFPFGYKFQFVFKKTVKINKSFRRRILPNVPSVRTYHTLRMAIFINNTPIKAIQFTNIYHHPMFWRLYAGWHRCFLTSQFAQPKSHIMLRRLISDWGFASSGMKPITKFMNIRQYL